MKNLFLALVVSLLSIYTIKAECNETTKQKLENLKSSIPYPKFNVGDTLYIAFINDPDIGINQYSAKDLKVYQVKIIGMRLINDISTPGYEKGLYLENPIPITEPITWEYQYLDLSLPNPKVRDFSNFLSEERFGLTREEALKRIGGYE